VFVTWKTIYFGAKTCIFTQQNNESTRELARLARYEARQVGFFSTRDEARRGESGVHLTSRVARATRSPRAHLWLYGRYFTIETDAQTLVWLLNQPPNDLPNAMMTRWLAYIRLFDFHVKHIPGNKNGGRFPFTTRRST